MKAAGVNPVIYPPLAAPGPAMSGVANLMFLQDLPGWRLTPIV